MFQQHRLLLAPLQAPKPVVSSERRDCHGPSGAWSLYQGSQVYIHQVVWSNSQTCNKASIHRASPIITMQLNFSSILQRSNFSFSSQNSCKSSWDIYYCIKTSVCLPKRLVFNQFFFNLVQGNGDKKHTLLSAFARVYKFQILYLVLLILFERLKFFTHRTYIYSIL